MSFALPQIKKPLGIVVYDGPSNINDAPIIAVATGIRERTDNRKTGNMIQIWILAKNQHPNEALQEGNDDSVCGNCKHRHMRSCYVNIGHGPTHVWKAFQRGIYEDATPKHLEYFRDQYVRFGSYGDPAAVPAMIWKSIAGESAGWTGYTHQWKSQYIESDLRDICMASCDDLKEVEQARSLGWKPFYVRMPGEALSDGFFECPASKAAGQRLTCSECRACSGGEYRDRQGTPSIEVHGPSWKMAYYLRARKAKDQKKRWMNINSPAVA